MLCFCSVSSGALWLLGRYPAVLGTGRSLQLITSAKQSSPKTSYKADRSGMCGRHDSVLLIAASSGRGSLVSMPLVSHSGHSPTTGVPKEVPKNVPKFWGRKHRGKACAKASGTSSR